METQRESEHSNLEVEPVEADGDSESFLGRIADVYYKPKSFEKSGRLYEALGVKYVQKAVMGTFGKIFRKAGFGDIAGPYFIGETPDLSSLKTYEYWTKFNETIHAVPLIWYTNGLIHDFGKDIPSDVIDALGILSLGALTMLQRYNRARVEKVIEWKEAKHM